MVGAVLIQELDQAREANVVTAAIAALAAIAAALPWPQYQQLLGQFLRLMRRHADGNKVTALLLLLLLLLLVYTSIMVSCYGGIVLVDARLELAHKAFLCVAIRMRQDST